MPEVLILDTLLPQDRSYNLDLFQSVEELGFDTRLVPHLEAPRLHTQLEEADAIIIAGVPLHYPSKSAEQLQPYLLPWLKTTRAAVLGICLGHQALGLAFGATMKRREEIEEGAVLCQVEGDHLVDPIFTDLDEPFKVRSLHSASIAFDESTPLIRLARSLPTPGVTKTGCANQVIRVADKPIYGLQFHPEKSALGKLFLKNFLELPGA